MIRQLCFAAVAVLLTASTCSANFVIDSFSSADYANGATSGIASASSGASLATTTTGGGAVSFNSTANTFGASGDTGDMVSFTYNFGDTLGTLTGLSVTNIEVPYSDLGNWDLDVIGDGTTLATVSSAPNDPSVFTGDLSGVTALELKFTANVDGATFQFGSAANSFTAVPEPTSLLMFPAAIGLVLARRRRKS